MTIEASPFLRIATYNVWNPLFEQKYNGQNTWEKRLPHIIENIITANPDILFMQEVSQESYNDMIKNQDVKKKYSTFYFSHATTHSEPKVGRDGLALFIKNDKIKTNQLRQSPIGARPSTRQDVYGDFEVIVNDKSIRFRAATVHLSSGNKEIGNLQLMKLVTDVLDPKSLDNLDFIVVTGDLNEGETDEMRSRADFMASQGFFTDGSTASTRNDVSNVRHKGHVDWIYVKKLTELPLKLESVEPIGEKDASDHKLVATDFVL